jgi:phospholipid/cholesterol/gamma-HCH transport system substrate-binding protein
VVVVMRRAAILVVAGLMCSSCAVLGLTPPCGSGTEVVAEFDQVGDLVNNSNVQSVDVQIGSVTDIELDHDNWVAQVTMCIDGDERISTDVRAVVRTTSLLGEKFVDLQVQSEGPPFLQDGDVIEVASTGKATELEDVFAELASILGTGNLEQLNRFTTAQANILRDHAGELRDVLGRLHDFTGVLAGRKNQLGSALDSLDAVARNLRGESSILKSFLRSFAGSSSVLSDQSEELQNLLFALDRFTDVSVQLLNATESGLNEQFADLRPVLETLVANSANLRKTLQTLATFSEYFPESMPGDYLQLDVCFQLDETYEQGTDCPQSDQNDDPTGDGSFSISENSLELILRQPLEQRGER